MDPLKVGIRELRGDLPKFLINTGRPLAVTRHGETVGYYIPTRRKIANEQRDALLDAARQIEQMMAAAGIDEETLAADFEALRKADEAK